MSSELATLLDRGLIWKTGNIRETPADSGHSTGFYNLDAILPDRGWPSGQVVELLTEHSFVGEMSLVLPTMARLEKTAHIAWVDPPCMPYAVAMQQWGLNLPNNLWIESGEPANGTWTVEQLSASGHFRIVLFWPQAISYPHTRRLQLAAGKGNCLVFLFRPMTEQQQNSGASLRLGMQYVKALSETERRLEMRILKGRQGSIQRQTLLDLPGYPGI